MTAFGRMEAIVDNAAGRTPLLLVCEHATNILPAPFGDLGLSPAQLEDHVAWDIGALALARVLARRLDAALIAAPASRLIVDPNRDHAAHDLIPSHAEGLAIPGNANVSADERAARIAAFHDPYHDAIEAHLKRRPDVRALVSVHSFTPALFGKARPWHAGMLHDADTRLADPLIDILSREPDLVIGRNVPYAPEQGVFYSMNRHAGARATVMIEVRNDLIGRQAGQERWADRLREALHAALDSVSSATVGKTD